MGRWTGISFGACLATSAVLAVAGSDVRAEGLSLGQAPTEESCTNVQDAIRTDAGGVVIGFRSTIRIEGFRGCAPEGSRVRIDVESERVFLAAFDARADGSFISPPITLPPTLNPGPHRIIVLTPSGDVARPVLVEFVATNGGADAPATGGSLALLVLWGMALIAAGTALAAAAWRAVRTLDPMRLMSIRRRRPEAPKALPPPEVPFFDTTGFGTKPATPPMWHETITEADAPQADRTKWRDRPSNDSQG
jgi:hypothetical protein